MIKKGAGMMCPVNYEFTKCYKRGYNNGTAFCDQCKHLVKVDRKYRLRRFIKSIRSKYYRILYILFSKES